MRRTPHRLPSPAHMLAAIRLRSLPLLNATRIVSPPIGRIAALPMTQPLTRLLLKDRPETPSHLAATQAGKLPALPVLSASPRSGQAAQRALRSQ